MTASGALDEPVHISDDAPAKRRRVPGPAGRALDAIDVALQVICMALMVVVVVSVMVQVLARYVTEQSTAWTAELASYSFVWLAMLAIALGVRRGRHMLLDIWEYISYRQWLNRLINTVAAVIVLSVLALLVWYGIEALGPAWRRLAPGLNISTGWVALAVPVGSAFALLFGLEAWWLQFMAKEGEDPLVQPLLMQPADVIIIKGEV